MDHCTVERLMCTLGLPGAVHGEPGPTLVPDGATARPADV
jgi:hypothetical protein